MVTEKSPLHTFSCQIPMKTYEAILVACETRGCKIRRFVADALDAALKKAGK